MDSHVKIIGILYLVFSILGIIGALVLFLTLNLIGQFIDDSEVVAILSIVATVVATVMAVCSVPGIIAGWGLLKYQEWARILTIILSALNILNFPFGTALGIYAIWALVQPETIDLFGSAAPNIQSR
ncbi:hypothetical protein [Mangrovibacterium marinum]|uniref:Uncharacterized protein n=1 Tax=Mangrovibacterium marinum TaxID=1639118 RepID=A0A2T5BZZ6_9BACT|nr:hypothetical protein [Mangrovibacterium marinum]PTN07872.1 hypothetical protein C8N47_11234 [Mangrovibacterium marinum]